MRHAEEALTLNAPKPRDKSVAVRVFVDSDHAGNKKDRRPRTGFMVYLNNKCYNSTFYKWPFNKFLVHTGLPINDNWLFFILLHEF